MHSLYNISGGGIMVTVLLNRDDYGTDLDKIVLNDSNVKILDTTFTGVEENQPVIFRINDKSFYGPVTTNRIIDVIKGNADDLKIQTARLFNVEMMKYISELKYREIVKLFSSYITKIDQYDKDLITKEIYDFCQKNNFQEYDVFASIQIALIKTTRGPALADLIVGFGKKETEHLLNEFLTNYKHRF